MHTAANWNLSATELRSVTPSAFRAFAVDLMRSQGTTFDADSTYPVPELVAEQAAFCAEETRVRRRGRPYRTAVTQLDDVYFADTIIRQPMD